MAIVSFATGARAHGPPPAVVAVTTVDAAGPRVVVTTEGLGVRGPGGFRYVCPAVFGTEPSPPAASSDGETTFVTGTTDLFALGPDGVARALERSELSRRWVLRLVVLGGQVVALRLADGFNDLRPLDGSAPIWSAPAPHDSVTEDAGAVWLARSADSEGIAERVSSQGAVLRTVRFPIRPSERVAQVRELAGLVYATLVTPSLGGRLLAVGDGGAVSVLLESRAPVSGPVPAGDHAFAAADGTLHRISGTTIDVVDSPGYVHGVFVAASSAYASIGVGLHDLEPSGPGPVVVDMTGFDEPDLGLVPPSLHSTCLAEWQVLRADLERSGALPGSDAGAPDGGSRAADARPAGGCAVASSGSRGTAAWMTAIAALAWRRVARVTGRAPRRGSRCAA